MKIMLTKMKPNSDDYQLTHITCFEKPFGIAIDGLMNGYSSLFFMYLKLLTTHECLIKDYDLFDLCEEILPNLGLGINRFYGRDLVQTIQNEIDAGKPILVPGNLKELYYSSHFSTDDWPHMFLIVGYDDEHKLFFVLDGSQKRSNDHKYEEFVIPYHIITEMFDSYLHTYKSENCIVSLEKTKQEIDIQQFIIDSLDLYIKQRINIPHVEVVFFEALESSDNPSISLSSNIFLKNINYKEVFFSELFMQLTSYTNIDQDHVELLSSNVKLLVDKWRKAITKYVVNFNRGKIGSWREIIKPALEQETEIYTQVQKLYEKVKQLTFSSSQSSSLWFYENNHDKIIAEQSSNLVFDFSNSKLYNSWINDESPKAFLNQEFKGENFVFSCEVTSNDADLETDYHGGIVFRNIANELFFWGIYRGQFLWLQKIGDFNILNTTKISSVHLILELEQSNGILIFRHGYNRDQMNEVYRTSVPSRIDQVGVGCKTWGQYRDFSIIFSNANIKLESAINGTRAEL